MPGATATAGGVVSFQEGDDMSEVEDKVLAETKRFHKALPDLLPKYRGRWVVFRDGVVQGDHATEEQAFADGMKRYGVKGGFVVAVVAEVTPKPITARVLYGVA
jgi:hypothetical protein